jgi:polysaccharide biosynthesis transport protein
LRTWPKSVSIGGKQQARVWGFEGEMSDGNAGPVRTTTLRDYLHVARRRKWIIVQAVVLLPLVAVGLSLHARKVYRASAEVLLATQNVTNQLNGINDPTLAQDPDRRAQTQADLARVPTVASETLRNAGLNRSVDDFLNHSSATAKTNADLLELSADDHHPDVARRLATAYANAFAAYRAQLDTAPYVAAKRRANTQLREMAAAGDHGSRAYELLVGKRDQLDQMVALLTRNAVPVQLPDRAVQIAPRPVRNGILAVVLGLVLGLGLAFLREALDTRVRSAGEVEEGLGLPLLARIPGPPAKLRNENRAVMLGAPHSPQAETFRLLRTNLDFVRLGHQAKTILITSALEREGKSTTAANLSIALARAGRRVALVDLDLRRPTLDRFFDVSGRPGLTQLVLGEARLDDVLAPLAFTSGNGHRNGSGPDENGNGGRIESGQLVVIGSGPVPPNPGEFVGTPAVARILESLRQTFDDIVIDTPPALQVGDAMSLSNQVDGVLVVCRMNLVHRSTIHELRRVLDASPAEKLGFVLAGAESEDGYGYGQGAYYYPAAPKRRDSYEPHQGSRR